MPSDNDAAQAPGQQPERAAHCVWRLQRARVPCITASSVLQSQAGRQCRAQPAVKRS